MFISACYFPTTALNSICDTFLLILMSYQSKLALMPYDHYIFVAAYDIEILKA